MKRYISPQLINKYINGKCTPEEIETLHGWYESMENGTDPLEMLSVEDREKIKNLMLSKIKSRIEPLNKNPEVKHNFIPKLLIYTFSGIAALFLLIQGIVFFNNKIPVSHTASEEIVINNLTKKIHKEILSDGSIVWLNPNSRLEYPEKFSGTLRTVKMKGEAFFEVTKDQKHPFVIYSGGVVTRVWGTSFRIKAFEGIRTEVSVITGKVSVKIPSKKDSEVILFHDQKITYLKDGNLLKKEHEQALSSIRMWKKTNLSFDNVPLSEVILILNKRFGCEIFTDDEILKSYLMKADFNDQRLPDILEMLEKSLEVNYKMNDQKIILIRKPDNQY